MSLSSPSMDDDQDCITPETDTSQPIERQDDLNTNTELQQGAPGVQVELETFEHGRDDERTSEADPCVETHGTTVSQDTVGQDSLPDPGLEYYSSDGPNAESRHAKLESHLQESVEEGTVSNRHTQSTEDLESTEQQDSSLSLSPSLQQDSRVAGTGSYHGEPSSSLTSLSTSQNRGEPLSSLTSLSTSQNRGEPFSSLTSLSTSQNRGEPFSSLTSLSTSQNRGEPSSSLTSLSTSQNRGEPSSSLTSLSTSQNRTHSDCSTSLTASATPLTISEQEVDIESGGRISSYLLVSSEGMPDTTKFESPGLLYARGSKEKHNRDLIGPADEVAEDVLEGYDDDDTHEESATTGTRVKGEGEEGGGLEKEGESSVDEPQEGEDEGSQQESQRKRKYSRQVVPIDPGVLLQLETHAHRLAAELTHTLDNLRNSLHAMTVCSMQSVQLHRESIDNLHKAVDSNIKAMYTFMAKFEELNKNLGPLQKIAAQIREINEALRILERNF